MYYKSKYFARDKHKGNYKRLSELDFKFISENLHWFEDTKGLYFASGDYFQEIHDSIDRMKVNKLILVDYQFKESIIINNIAILALEATDAIKLFKYFNIKFDVFICLNDGVYEGGGSYNMHSQYFIAYVMPILKNPYTHIYSQNYLEVNDNRHINDIGYTPNKIEFEGNAIFLRYKPEHINMYKMTKDDVYKEVYLNGDFKINIINKSIWLDEHILDRMYIRSRKEFYYFTRTARTNLIYSKKSNGKNYIITRVLTPHPMHTVGSMPIGASNYKTFLCETKTLKGEINLYHLNSNDYSYIKQNLELIEKIKEPYNELPVYQPNRYKNKIRPKEIDEGTGGLHVPPQLRIF